MLSIIVCSIRPDQAERLKNNIHDTIGIPFEFIAYDNRGTGKGICQVYNECAGKARFDNLCFIHEDVEFLTENWGEKIVGKLAEKDCGVIGFAGSAMKSKALTGWRSTTRYGIRNHYVQCDDSKEFICKTNPYNEDYSGVVTLDGLCLFCSKMTWKKIKFDDSLLKGFHCYDIDFTIAAHISGLKNWICNTIMIKHFSIGKYDYNWWKDTVKIHKKWQKHLPIYISDKPSLYKVWLEFRSNIEWTNIMSRNNVFQGIKQRYIWGYIATHPLNGKSYRLLAKYMKYRRNYNRTSKK